jgi:hypothetical protein
MMRIVVIITNRIWPLGVQKMGDNITIYMVFQNHPVCSAPKELYKLRWQPVPEVDF